MIQGRGSSSIGHPLQWLVLLHHLLRTHTRFSLFFSTYLLLLHTLISPWWNLIAPMSLPMLLCLGQSILSLAPPFKVAMGAL
jgi:hypothetical protein